MSMRPHRPPSQYAEPRLKIIKRQITGALESSLGDMITVREVTEENLDDVFRVCSRGKLGDPTRMKGIGIKRAWMMGMMRDVGPVSMVAYMDGEPAAQAMYYP